MRFAQPDTAIQEQRVVRFSGRLRHSKGGRVREVIVVADHESLEVIRGIEGRLNRSGDSLSGQLGFRLLRTYCAWRFDLRPGVYLELNFQLLAGSLRDGLFEHPPIIILQPAF